MSPRLRRILGARERTPAALITAALNPDNNGGWAVSWAGDGVLPRAIHCATLVQAVDEAATAVATLYGRYPPVPEAELQLAIFPSRYRGGAMFDIGGHPGAFSAHDIQGSDRTVAGATLEDLLQAVRKIDDIPEGHYMFRWVRPVASLPLPPEVPRG